MYGAKVSSSNTFNENNTSNETVLRSLRTAIYSTMGIVSQITTTIYKVFLTSSVLCLVTSLLAALIVIATAVTKRRSNI